MEKSDVPTLTSLAHSSGCGCKVAPSGLSEILSGLKQSPGFDSIQGHEDASVYWLNETDALLATVDFFMPVVDDPFEFGAIAAANALSDVYAMGGQPIQAISVLGWPISKLPAYMASEVLKGAESSCRKAGISISGGHTVDSHEPFFGLSVNGFVKKQHLKPNSGVQQGDYLFLTKPLGCGMILSAIKRGRTDIFYQDALESMKKLNDVGVKLSSTKGINAITDVTGFGFLGHASEMISDKNLSLKVGLQNIPRFNGVETCMKSFIYPDITTSNFNFIKERVSDLSAEALFLLCDPQTSGGLLVSASPDAVSAVKQILRDNHCPSEPIGRFETWQGKSIFVEEQL